MSTSGGSRGERNAKPKFQTIDINTLHRSSRGETSEPSKQNSQAVRKPGMQCLGKVPSARRPANLPSLKAETSTPADQQGSWGGGANAENQSSTQNTQPQVVTSAQITPSVAPTNTTSSSSTSVAVPINQSLTNSQNSISSNTSVTNHHHHQHHPNPHNTPSNISNLQSSTWSSVATGHVPEQTGQPPLYQSPQFQHEFPSLDGSTATGSKSSHQQHQHSIQQQHVSTGQSGNSGGGNGGMTQQTHEMSLRPQTNSGNWIQQQPYQQQSQSGGNGNRGGENIGNGPNSQQGQGPQSQIPLPFQFILPQFMMRGETGGGGPQTGSAGGQNFGLPQNQNYSQNRPRSQPGAQSQIMYDNNFYGGGGGGGGGGHQLMPSRRNQPPQKRPQQEDRSSSVPANEPEIIHHRPIINKEELERLDSLVKDDGWANPDNIDYNKKLEFSDDETCDDDNRPANSASNKIDKKMNQQIADAEKEEEKRAAWREREKDRMEHDRLERERNEKNERDRNLNISNSSSSNIVDKDRDRASQSQQLLQQNGHRNEQDFANENRFTNDRRNNNSNNNSDLIEKKKYSDMDSAQQKRSGQQVGGDGVKPLMNTSILKRTPSDRDFGDDKRLMQQKGNDDFRSQMGGDRDRDRGGMDKDRGFGRDRENYRIDRDMSSRERDNFRMDSRDRERELGRDGSGASIPFSRQFQSNLPPRFQKQQMERNTGSGNYMSSGGARTNPSGGNNFHQNNDKNIPFAQQYDARYIHSNYKSQQQQQQSQIRGGEAIRRNPSDEMILNRRRRGDSEDDDRFSSGRESIGRNSNSGGGGGGGGHTPQLARSISDSSQRKTSVSSEENHRIERSESRELSQLVGSSPVATSNITSTILAASSTVTTATTINNTTSWADEIELERGVKLEMANNNNSNLNNLTNNNNLINNKTETNDNFLLSKESTSNQLQQQHDEPIIQILQRSNSSNSNSCNVSNSSNISINNSANIVSTSDAFSKETNNNNTNFPTATSPEPHQNQGFVKEKSPKPWVDSVPDIHESKELDKSISSDNCDDIHRKSLESIPETKSVSSISNEKEKQVGSSSNLKNHSNENLNMGSEQKHGGIKRIPSSNQSLSSSSRGGGGGGHLSNMGNRPPAQRDNNRGGYSNYRSWNHQGGRGGRSNRGGRYDSHNWTDTGSDGSDIDDEYMARRNERSPKVPRKDGSNQRYDSSRSGGSGGGGNMGGPQHNKEGFAPRGEPSRRGRGGGGNTAPNSFRRGGGITSSTKRIEGYGPPNAKSPFSHSDEKSSQSKDNLTEDKTKLNQIALNSGLMSNKSTSPGISNNNNAGGIKKDDKSGVNSTIPAQGNNLNKNVAIDKKLSPPKITQSAPQNAPSAKSPTVQTGQTASNNKSESQNIKKDEKSINKKEEPLPQRTQHPSASAQSKLKEQPKQQQQSMSQHQNNQMSKSFGGPNNQQSQMNKSNSKQQPINSQNAQNSQRQQQQHQQQPQQQCERANVKLPPRFAKQQQMVNRSNSSGSTSDGQSNSSSGNAWEKPLISSTLQDMSSGNLQNLESNDNEMNKDGLCKIDNSKQPLLDGTTPPVTTIIFENTNYKTPQQAPVKRQQNSPIGSAGVNNASTQMQQGAMKGDSDVFKSQGSQVQQPAIQNMIDAQQQQSGTPDSIMMSALSNMTFPSTKSDAEFEKDINLTFFDADISQLTDEKTANSVVNQSKTSGPAGGLCMARNMHSATSSAQSLMLPSTADLDLKIASVKRVWENVPTMPNVLEHTQPDDHSGSHFVTSHQPHLQYVPHGNMVALSPGPSYSTSFGQEQSALEHFAKQDSEQDYSGQQHSVVGQNNHSHQNQNMGMVNKHPEQLGTSANVCKVKPNQQQIHQSGISGLSPPPMQQGTLTGPQFYSPTQYGNMPTIPSPPAVVFNSSIPSQGGLYAPFIEQGRPGYSQYPHFGTSNTPYNTFMQTQPNMQAGPTPDMFQNLGQYRMSQQPVQNTFNQNHQLNNSNTLLISSSSNSLMSASVKPSSQQIGAIGSKSGTVGHPAIGQQSFLNMYTQQGPPMQNNSYYANSAGNQAPFFGGPGGAGAQTYGLQATGIFGGPGGPAPSNGPPQQQVAGFSSQYLPSPILAAAISPYRGGPTSQATPYLKSNQPQSHMQDPTGRQIKSPLNSEGGINLKQPPPQTSPPHHKNYPPSWELQNQVLPQQQQQQQVQQQQPPPNVNNRNNGGGGLSGGGGPGGNNSGRLNQQSQQQQSGQRYIAPIQRPTNYSQQQQQQQQQQQNMMQTQNPRNPRMNVSHQNSGPNKHYINPNVGGAGRGTHGSNQSDQTTINKVATNHQDKSNLEGQSSGGVIVNSQEASKDDIQKE